MARVEVLVIGAGVSGLTTAVQLAENGHQVSVIADRRLLETTSAVAGASWGPYMVTHPRVAHWSEETRRVFERLADEHSSTGVRSVHGIEASISQVDLPAWALQMPQFAECAADELPPGYTTGWRYTLPLLNMERYLGYLEQRLRRAGGHIRSGTVDSLTDIDASPRYIVNCTGLGAERLVPDTTMHRVWGQLVIVRNPGVTTFFQDNCESEELTYVLPHGDIVALGGIAVEEKPTDEERALNIKAILERCVQVEPMLRHATILTDRMAPRPSRPTVRVESERLGDKTIVHNYGHGGAGVTLSWGCALEVQRLIEADTDFPGLPRVHTTSESPDVNSLYPRGSDLEGATSV